MPDIGTKFGQDVDEYRKLVEAVKVEVITYGVFLNRSLSPSILPMMAKYFTQEKVGKVTNYTANFEEVKCKRIYCFSFVRPLVRSSHFLAGIITNVERMLGY